MIERARRAIFESAMEALTDAHMRVLAVFAREPFAFADDVATALGLQVTLVRDLIADLERAGKLEPAPI